MSKHRTQAPDTIPDRITSRPELERLARSIVCQRSAFATINGSGQLSAVLLFDQEPDRRRFIMSGSLDGLTYTRHEVCPPVPYHWFRMFLPPSIATPPVAAVGPGDTLNATGVREASLDLLPIGSPTRPAISYRKAA